jgi:hypothetical protein
VKSFLSIAILVLSFNSFSRTVEVVISDEASAAKFERFGKYLVVTNPRLLGFPVSHSGDVAAIYFCGKLGLKFYTYSTVYSPLESDGRSRTDVLGFYVNTNGSTYLSKSTSFVDPVICQDQ